MCRQRSLPVLQLYRPEPDPFEVETEDSSEEEKMPIYIEADDGYINDAVTEYQQVQASEVVETVADVVEPNSAAASTGGTSGPGVSPSSGVAGADDADDAVDSEEETVADDAVELLALLIAADTPVSHTPVPDK